MTKNHDDYEAEKRRLANRWRGDVARDGEVLRVPMALMDSTQKGIHDEAERPARPAPRPAVAARQKLGLEPRPPLSRAAERAVQAAHQEHNEAITNAWKGPKP